MADQRQELNARVDASGAEGLQIITELASNVPAVYPLTITRGADWTLLATWYSQPSTPEDLSSGYTAALTIFDEPGGTALVSLTSSSGITLAATAPTITATIAKTAVDAYTWGPAATYLLTVTTGGVTRALLTGRVVLRDA